MDEDEHYGPGQPMNAADVAAIIAERDRLLAVADDATIDATALVAERADLEDEVDRLRAVVDVVRRYVSLIEAPDAAVDQQERLAVHLELLRRLRELDGSADMGGTEG